MSSGLRVLASVVSLALAASAPAAVLGAAAPAAPPLPAPQAGDWRTVDPDNLLVIDTSKGRVLVEMRPEVAPEYVERIRALAGQGFYDGLQFFRVIDTFMAQTGDPANTGAGGSTLPPLKGLFSYRRSPGDAFVAAGPRPGGGVFGFAGALPVYSQPDDLAALTADGMVRAWGSFCPGVAGMARTNDPDSAGTQFFLMRQSSPPLDERYTPWGRVVVGLDVVRALTVGEPPANPDTMTRVRAASQLPEAERPNVRVLDPASAAFQARVAAARQARGAQFTVCDVEVPAEVG